MKRILVQPGHAAMFFNTFQISVFAITLFKRPLRAAPQHSVHSVMVQVYLAPTADARRNRAVQLVRQRLFMGPQFGNVKAGMQGADAAGYIKTYAAADTTPP